MVEDEEWERYIEIGNRDKVICLKCYNQIKEWTEKYS